MDYLIVKKFGVNMQGTTTNLAFTTLFLTCLLTALTDAPTLGVLKGMHKWEVSCPLPFVSFPPSSYSLTSSSSSFQAELREEIAVLPHVILPQATSFASRYNATQPPLTCH